jgi:hypothetical protein
LSLVIWKPEALFNLFNQNWESSQLKAVVEALNILDVNAIIAGGTIVRSLLGMDIFKGDIDIFPVYEDGLNELIARYKDDKTWEKSPHAYNVQFAMGMKKTKLQIITRDKPATTEKTLHCFDLEHCKLAVGHSSIKGISFGCTIASLVCLAKKELRLGLVRDPNYSMGRAIKYKRLGFEADKAIEQLAAMSIKGMKDVQCCGDYDTPFSFESLDEIIASTSS